MSEDVKAEHKRGSYKLLVILPIGLLILSLGILFVSYATTGEWFIRSVELKGGSLITIDTPATAADVENVLSSQVSASVRSITGFSGQQVIIETDADPQRVLGILSAGGVKVLSSSSTVIGPALSQAFWAQAQWAIFIAFVAMSAIVFIIFRKVVICVNVLFAAFTDLVATLALMQVFGIELSLAGIAALLMMLGYSIDSDIMLGSRVLKGVELLKERVFDAFKTGMTMSLTTIGALAALIFIGISPVLSQIASVLIIGVAVDIATTWGQNSVLLRWYVEKRGEG